jgi:Ca-activated chloride channel family protein
MSTPQRRRRFATFALVAAVTGCASMGRYDASYAPRSYAAADGDDPETAAATPNPDGGTFKHAGVNPEVQTADDRLSTFAVDVDTGSWMYAKRVLAGGGVPAQGSVRVEELVNAMHYDYAAPARSDDEAVSVHVASAPSPFRAGKHVVRVALQARRVSDAERKPATLTFLVDVSGSMDEADKLGYVREGLHMAVDALRPDDRVALVTYAGSTRVVLPATPVTAENKRRIHGAIDELSAGGGTFMSSGMQLAYEQAAQELDGHRTSRVFVLSDGDANIGSVGHEEMLQAIGEQVAKGVTMSTMGFGTGNYNDYLMEQLADAGNGNYTYIGDHDAMKRFFVTDMTANLELVAADAKVQVEWNPDVVTSYRLLGYENRDVADKDFRNDRKDAGEIGSGHATTALYEVTLASKGDADLGTVRVRYKLPGHADAREMAAPIAATSMVSEVDALDADAQAAIAMALGAEILRGSPYADGLSLVDAALLLRRSAKGPHADERTEAADLFMKAAPSVASSAHVAAAETH